MTYHLLITIDVEDWFQVENFKQCIPYSSWPSRELRVEKNTHRLLNLFDSVAFQNRTTSNQQPVTNNEIKATFFVLGWIAERLPHLVREIHSRGHEVASHGYYHNLCTECSSDDLKTDLINSKKLLEDIVGDKVYGYRAPNFSINDDILKVIEGCGYLYDSSYNSFGMHGRYGHLDLSKNGTRGVAHQISKIQSPKSKILYELPISNLRLGNSTIPWGGGGYFRLIPFPLFKIGVQSILKTDSAYLFYMHPWEIDPEQPVVKQAPGAYKFRHYVNLRSTHAKLLKFIESFQDHRFITCRQYISELDN